MGVDAIMFVKVGGNRTKDRVQLVKDVAEAAYDIAAVFGASTFHTIRLESSDKDWWPNGRRALELVNSDDDDGPAINPTLGEVLIEVNLGGCYWGPGYERGSIGELIGIAMWLEERFSPCEVWYGGDSGMGTVHFNARTRQTYVKHAAGPDGWAYRRAWGMDNSDSVPIPLCSLCKKPYQRYGYGGSGNFGSFSCLGCGDHLQTHNKGVSWQRGDKWHNGKESVDLSTKEVALLLFA